MSKERARLRAERQAAERVARARRARRRLWRERRRAVTRAMAPRLPDRRTGRLFARWSRRQRGAIAAGVGGCLLIVWGYVPTLSARLALSILVLTAAPMLAVLVFDRRNRTWL